MDKNILYSIVGIGLLCIGLVVGNVVGQGESDLDIELDILRNQIELLEENRDSLIDFVEIKERENKELRDTIQDVNEEISDLEKRNGDLEASARANRDRADSLRIVAQEALLTAPPEIIEYVSSLETQVDTLEEQVTVQAAQILRYQRNDTLQEAIIRNQSIEIDSLVTFIEDIEIVVPDSDDNIFGFIPLPDRKTSFLLGAGTTLVIILAASAGR